MIVTEFHRTGHFPKEDISYNVFEFMFDMGPSIAQTGPVKNQGKPNAIFGMDFNWFFSANHGMGFAFQWERDFDNKIKYNHGSIFSGDLHYAYRHFMTPKLTFNFEPGFGYQGLYGDYNCGRYCSSQSFDSTFMFDYRLMFQYMFSSWNIADIDVMNFFAGAGMVQQYGVTGDTEGSRFGLLFRFGFGF
jgi:hypothetical protein